MQRVVAGAVVGLTFGATLVPASYGGGKFEEIVAIGKGGATRTITLAKRGARSDSSLFHGKAMRRPNDGYLRVFPFIGGLTGIPGRFYPREGVLCLSWTDQPAGCRALGAAGQRLMSPLRNLPLRTAPPTSPIGFRGKFQSYSWARRNVLVAIEMGFDRRPHCCEARPTEAIPVVVTWRGPLAAHRPNAFALTPAGIYSRRAVYPL